MYLGPTPASPARCARLRVPRSIFRSSRFTIWDVEKKSRVKNIILSRKKLCSRYAIFLPTPNSRGDIIENCDNAGHNVLTGFRCGYYYQMNRATPWSTAAGSADAHATLTLCGSLQLFMALP